MAPAKTPGSGRALFFWAGSDGAPDAVMYHTRLARRAGSGKHSTHTHFEGES